jgi:hypothetical protein
MTSQNEKLENFASYLINSYIYETTIDPLKKILNKTITIILKKDSKLCLYNDMNVEERCKKWS